MRRINVQQSVILLAFVFLSLCTCLILLFDVDKPEYYTLLPLLPLVFGVSSVIFYQLYSVVPSNIGASILILLFFVRDVASPLLLWMGDYSVTITKNVESNTGGAILLVAYETVAVIAVMYHQMYKYRKYGDCICKTPVSRRVSRRYGFLLFSVLAVLLVCIAVTPSLMLGYRSILQISDKTFTHFEDAYIVAEYGTTFIKKLSLVIGQYLMRSMMVFIPAFFIVLLSRKRTLIRQAISLGFCLVPLFFIGGAIARSLIYVVCLLLLQIQMFSVKVNYKKILGLGIFAALIVVVWWVFRTAVGGSMDSLATSFSQRFSAYFSGVNVVSGVFNLPDELASRVRYFAYDFLGSVPFGTTLFGLSGDRIQPFFNLHNASSGQIPPTIAMGYYYFGPLLAPLYSVVFTLIAFRSGNRIEKVQNPFARIRLILMAVYFSLGVVMYNIEIVLSTAFSIFLPMYVIERIAYRGGNR